MWEEKKGLLHAPALARLLGVPGALGAAAAAGLRSRDSRYSNAALDAANAGGYVCFAAMHPSHTVLLCGVLNGRVLAVRVGSWDCAAAPDTHNVYGGYLNRGGVYHSWMLECADMKKKLGLLLVWLSLWVVAPLALLRMLWAIFTNPDEAWQVALAFDDLANVATNGRLGQTISSRAAHDRPQVWACWLCKLLDAVDKGHCDRAMTAQDQNLEK